jgi:hypothetical protein
LAAANVWGLGGDARLAGEFLGAEAVVVVWTDAQRPVGHRHLRSTLERRGFVVEDGTAYDDGFAVSARLGAAKPVTKAA